MVGADFFFNDNDEPRASSHISCDVVQMILQLFFLDLFFLLLRLTWWDITRHSELLLVCIAQFSTIHVHSWVFDVLWGVVAYYLVSSCLPAKWPGRFRFVDATKMVLIVLYYSVPSSSASLMENVNCIESNNATHVTTVEQFYHYFNSDHYIMDEAFLRTMSWQLIRVLNESVALVIAFNLHEEWSSCFCHQETTSLSVVGYLL